MSKSKSKSRGIVQPINIAVEVFLPDGSVSLNIGRLVSRGKDSITLEHAAFVKDTGRRSEFFAGRFDSDVEIETYPDEMTVELPGKATVYSWPHPLPRETK